MDTSVGPSERFFNALITSRPSKSIKSPYVSDLIFEDKSISLGHTPSLGCNGLAEANKEVLVVKRYGSKTGKCKYTVILANVEEKTHKYFIGLEPGRAEKMAENILRCGLWNDMRATTLDTQFTYEDCRFDFKGITSKHEPFICEVKNVSIAEYDNIRPSLLKKQDFSNRAFNSKIAIFPSGYKPKGRTHSERALKQTQRLTQIKKKHPEMRCIIMYIIQRPDVCQFQISNGDETYKKAIKEAKEAGVELAAIVVEWKRCDDNEHEHEHIRPYLINTNLPITI